MRRWKENIKMRNEKDWVEEVSRKSMLQWYKLAKNCAGVARLCRLRTDSSWWLEEKKRCKMIIDERWVMCGSGAGEDVTYLLVMWGI